MWDLRRLNKAKEFDCAARGLDEIQKGDFVELGSESPLFRYACNIHWASPISKLPSDLQSKTTKYPVYSAFHLTVFSWGVITRMYITECAKT